MPALFSGVAPSRRRKQRRRPSQWPSAPEPLASSARPTWTCRRAQDSTLLTSKPRSPEPAETLFQTASNARAVGMACSLPRAALGPRGAQCQRTTAESRRSRGHSESHGVRTQVPIAVGNRGDALRNVRRRQSHWASSARPAWTSCARRRETCPCCRCRSRPHTPSCPRPFCPSELHPSLRGLRRGLSRRSRCPRCSPA